MEPYKEFTINPDNAETHNHLGILYAKQGRLERAIASYLRAIEIKPEYAGAYVNLGIAMMHQGRTNEAIQNYRYALNILPGFADAFYNLGNALKAQGNLNDALKNYRHAIENDPNHVEAHRQIGVVHQYSINDPDFIELIRLEKNNHFLTQERKISLHFALGKAYSDIQEYDVSFSHFEFGATLKRNSINYNINQDQKIFQAIEKNYSKTYIDARKNIGCESNLPIFILGMPRSGTTLVEQILASHPDVYGAGELIELEKAVQDNFLSYETDSWNHDSFRESGEKYIASLLKLKPKAEIKHVTDKMPANFLFIGYIHLILPGSRIIHCVRNPMDTCLSCYQKLFTEKHAWSYDLKELGRYYALYKRLMDHWKRLLPNRFLEVSYEDLTSDPKAQIHRILKYCGLPWNEKCETFYKTKRNITTASDIQVRRPLYRSSVNRWTHYEKHLGPLYKSLEENGVQF